MISTIDEQRLTAALTKLGPSIRPSMDGSWARPAAVRVIDCVLSLRNKYEATVVPRLDQFEKNYPQVRTVVSLSELISQMGPQDFIRTALTFNSLKRATALNGVVQWLVPIAGTGSEQEQLEKLEGWAVNADPEDHRKMSVSGFALAGFQYLRMLFGANTTKPDVHICAFVSSEVGRAVTPLEALHLLEKAARAANVSLRNLDATIWEQRAGWRTRVAEEVS